MTPLSAHFSLEEATMSQTAARNGIDNSPSPQVLANMREAALGMEMVRMELNSNAILVSSWLRVEALERIVARDGFLAWCRKRNLPPIEANWVKYFATKSHPKGFAIDFTCPTFGTPEKVMQRIVASKIPFQQCILEYSRWVHVDFDGNAREALVIDNTGPRSFA